MPSAESRIQTEHSSRYLVQLCQHAKKFDSALQHLRLHAQHAGADHPRPRVLQVEWTDTTGAITLNWGTCALHADHDTLTVRIDAVDEENLRRVQDLITADLERFGNRDQLTMSWTRPRESTADPRD